MKGLDPSRHNSVECFASHCADCGGCGYDQELNIVAADLGRGAFLKVLCDVCWHRRKYRAELERRWREGRLTTGVNLTDQA